jgi:hypothetical protein
MITCPLCKEAVFDETHKYYLTDNSPQDFYCPTKAILSSIDADNTYSHYYRVTFQGAFPEYTIHIPPFHLSWIEVVNRLKIYNSMHKSQTNSVWKFVPNVDFQELLHWVKRLQMLKAFA